MTCMGPSRGVLTAFCSSDFDEISKRYPVPLKAKRDYASLDSIVSGPKKKSKSETKSAAAKTTGEARNRRETPRAPAIDIHHPVLHQGKPCAEKPAPEGRDVPPRQRMSQSRPNNPQVEYPPFEYSLPTHHYASSQHGGYYHEPPAPSAQWHGYQQSRHYPGYYYPPAPPPPPPPPPQDVLQLHSDSANEDEKAWANFPSPPRSSPSSSQKYESRTMNEQKTNDGLCRESGDLYAPISLAEQSNHCESSDQRAPLPDDSLEEASRMFLCKTDAWIGMIGRDSVSAGGAGARQGSCFDYP